MEELQDEDGEEEDRSVKLCRAGGGGGGGGWDGGQLLKGSSNAETQQKPQIRLSSPLCSDSQFWLIPQGGS